MQPDEISMWAAFRERRTNIEKDVTRTDRDQAFFAGDANPNLERLFEVLLTYALYNYDVGYVQGMNFIAASPQHISTRPARSASECILQFGMHSLALRAGMR